MFKAEKKKKESPSMGAWQKLDTRLATMHALIHKKKENLRKLKAEWGASTDEQEKRYMGTSIKAARLDLEHDISFFEGLMEDSAATKTAVEGELESSASEDDEEEDEVEEEVPRGKAPRNLERRSSPRKSLTKSWKLK